MKIDNPDPAEAEEHPAAVFKQGRAKGGARFMGGEGCTYRDGSIVFGSSDGGDAGLGQIWRTRRPEAGKLDEEWRTGAALRVADRTQLDGPDNIHEPRRRIVIAEDGKLNSNFVVALLPNGTIVNVAQNLVPLQGTIIDASGKLYDPYVPDDGAAAPTAWGTPSSPGRGSVPTARGSS